MPTIVLTLAADIRYALRQLRRSPGFAATAILTLALGIGATTAIFTLMYQVMLRSLPVAHPEQIYKVGKRLNCCVTGSGQDDWSLFSYDFYRFLRDGTPGTAGMAAVQSGTTTVSARRAGAGSAAQPLALHFVSGNYFTLLGVQPFAGRMLRPDDDREGAPPTAVLSYALWRAKFGADPHLVGSTLLLTGHPVTVVGISSEKFIGERNTNDAPGLWLPLAQEPTLEPTSKVIRYPMSNWLDVLVRLPDPHTAAPVQRALQGELHQWINAHPVFFRDALKSDIDRMTTELAPASSGINDLQNQYERSLDLLLLVAGFVLLIACANLANLMLVRGMARQAELAVRSALGAPRARLVRQMLVEAVLLSILGGLAAVVVAYAGTRGMLALAMRGVEFSPISASPSLPVLCFALLLSLVTGVAFGTAPAWIASRQNPVEALRGANRSSASDRSALPQRLLVILQAALSLVLLSTAGLLITSLRHLEQQDFHFEPEGRLIVFTDLPAAGYSYERLAGLYQRIDDTFSTLPGVQSVGYGTYGPMAYNNWGTGVWFPGDAQNRDPSVGASYSAISPQFLTTVGTRVVAGRGITEEDRPTTQHVAVVNQMFVDHYLKGKQAIGQHFGPDLTNPAEFTIVGVVENTKYGDPSEPVLPMFFTSIRQATSFETDRDTTIEQGKHFATNLIVRYRGDESAAAASVRQALQQIDPEIPILAMRSYKDQLSTNFTQQDLVVRLTTLFGALALLLASIGLYGVTAYSVARRTGEIGIRMALGASRAGVLAMIVRSALMQALLGLALGLPLTFFAGRLLQHTLYQTSSFQPLVLLGVAALLLASAFAAAVIPARRAASIDPMTALRSE